MTKPTPTSNTSVMQPGGPAGRGGPVVKTIEFDRLIGATVGHYIVGQKLGDGGMGCVYVVRHKELLKRFAMKVLKPEYAARSDISARFKWEGIAGATIEHPNVVSTVDSFIGPDGMQCLVMEYLEGSDLGAALRDAGAPLSAARATMVLMQVACGLYELHRNGIVHRDLKPGNVFLARDPTGREVVKLLDFGVAKFVPAMLPTGYDVIGEGTPTRLVPPQTNVKVVMGTPHYMSPEQFGMDEELTLDFRTDIYSLGCLAFQVLTGWHAFHAHKYLEVQQLKLSGTMPPSVRRFVAELSPQWDTLIQTCVAYRPEDRYPDMRAVARALAATCMEGPALLEHYWPSVAIAPELPSGVLAPRLPPTRPVDRVPPAVDSSAGNQVINMVADEPTPPSTESSTASRSMPVVAEKMTRTTAETRRWRVVAPALGVAGAVAAFVGAVALGGVINGAQQPVSPAAALPEPTIVTIPAPAPAQSMESAPVIQVPQAPVAVVPQSEPQAAMPQAKTDDVDETDDKTVRPADKVESNKRRDKRRRKRDVPSAPIETVKQPFDPNGIF